MLRDARELEPGTHLEYDVCIVGGGAAGITLARQLRSSTLRIALLESGGLSADPASQDLTAGSSVGLGSDEYLRYSRLRFFGGTTNHWGGGCVPLDPHDFEPRSWVSHSGWPISRESLLPYYSRAQSICGAGEFDYALESWWTGTPPASPAAGISAGVRQVSIPPTRFGARYRAELAEDSRVDVWLHANLLRFRLGSDTRSVARAEVATLQGGRFTVSARAYVLACGGIENARLLLLSDAEQPHGIGNAHDLVGRFFMEHTLVYNSCEAIFADPALATFARPLRRADAVAVPYWSLAPAVQQAEGLLNAAIFAVQSGQPRRPLDQAVSQVMHEMLELPGARRGVTIFTSLHEQAPNPDSRVRLAERRDALGQRHVELDWRLSELDSHSLRQTFRVLASLLGGHDAGRLRLADWLDRDKIDWQRAWLGGGTQGDGRDFQQQGVRGGFHQMGTTRMSRDPGQGVVDPHCQVHGIANLYVAGSSVFPTGGWANPTLTIVALSLRLADELRSSLS